MVTYENLDEKTKMILECVNEIFKPPYDSFDKYWIGGGYTNLSIAQEDGHKIELKQGESLEDECIIMSILDEIPEEIFLRLQSRITEYKGKRIFYEKNEMPQAY